MFVSIAGVLWDVAQDFFWGNCRVAIERLLRNCKGNCRVAFHRTASKENTFKATLGSRMKNGLIVWDLTISNILY